MEGKAVTRRRLTDAPTLAGFTRDLRVARIRFPTAHGDLVLDVPLEHLTDLMRVAALSAERSANRPGTLEHLPALPVFEWEAGLTAEEQIALRLRIAGGGAVAFVLSRDLAASLEAGLGRTLDYAPDHRGRLH